MEKLNIEKIKQLLEKQGKTQVDFAHSIELQPFNVSAAFHGKREIPMKKILRIATYFNVSPYELV